MGLALTCHSRTRRGSDPRYLNSGHGRQSGLFNPLTTSPDGPSWTIRGPEYARYEEYMKIVVDGGEGGYGSSGETNSESQEDKGLRRKRQDAGARREDNKGQGGCDGMV